jgi:hypothetical protein
MQKTKMKIVSQVLVAAFVLLFVAGAPFAKGIKQRVKFPRGGSGVTLNGGVVRGDRDEYLLKAGKGQTMKVTITSIEDNAVFQIYAPNNKTLKGAAEGDDAMDWSGTLPLAGEYRIVVGGTRGNASYKITIEIE